LERRGAELGGRQLSVGNGQLKRRDEEAKRPAYAKASADKQALRRG
jgi:hypothetical protein